MSYWSKGGTLEVEELRHKVLDRLLDYLTYLLPKGRIQGKEFVVGSIDGEKGKSLKVVLEGERAGLWRDFATDEGGDIFSLTEKAQRLSFKETLDYVALWLGELPRKHKYEKAKRPEKYMGVAGKLGPVTACWEYQDVEGKLIAKVSRFDPPSGKEFRPWDAKTGKMQAPNRRPLYNQPGISKSDDVLLVEGEKCAQALIEQGFCATTAMNGANAPVPKTDWSPLSGKRVLIWPDNDHPGKTYAEAIGKALVGIAQRVEVLMPPKEAPPKWDAADAIDEEIDLRVFLKIARRKQIQGKIPVFSLGELLDDDSPVPEDLLAPRILNKGGLLLLGGAPKVGKSDFLLHLLAHMAAGEPFLGMTPSRPLKIFYLQAELQYDYLRERVKNLPLDKDLIGNVRRNLVTTAQLKNVLDEDGVENMALSLEGVFAEGPDVIVVDPIRNVFDGGTHAGGENDNAAMMFFLTQRIEKLRELLNPDAALILAHHTRKIPKQQMDEEPFHAFSGAHALRGYYTTGMLLMRPDEKKPERKLFFELRNGPEPKPKQIIKEGKAWREQAGGSVTTEDTGQSRAQIQEAERLRSRDIILQVLRDEAMEGRFYTPSQFAEFFENRKGLGSRTFIINQWRYLSRKGIIQYFRNYEDYNLPSLRRSKYGYMCIQGMKYGTDGVVHCGIEPTEYQCPVTGDLQPVEKEKNTLAGGWKSDCRSAV